MVKSFLLGLLLVSFSALSEASSSGYIRIENRAGFVISTNCWDENYNNGAGWKRISTGGFRSCHGAYMRVDIIGQVDNSKLYYWRRQFNCTQADRRLYLTIRGAIGTSKITGECFIIPPQG